MTRFRLAFAVVKYLEFGGMQRTLMRIARECVGRGHEVHLFTTKWQGEHPEGITAHLLDCRARTNHGRNREFAERLHEAMAGAEFDCVVGFNKIPGLDVYYAGDPCFVAKVAESRRPSYRWLPRYRGMRRLEAEVFGAGLTTELLLIAHQEKAKFIHHYGTEAERFHLLPPGINRERLQAAPPTAEEVHRLRSRFGVADDGYLILNVGAAFKTKGIDRAISAVAALPEGAKERCRLVVVGGDDSRPYQRLASRLGIGEQVLFPGAAENVAPYYAAADVLLHPAYTENTGTTLLEAMICGLPVLATANCGFAFHVERAAAGLICPVPFAQPTLDRLLAEMLTSNRRPAWQENGPTYCAREDLYSLIEKAADIIVARARRNRGQ